MGSKRLIVIRKVYLQYVAVVCLLIVTVNIQVETHQKLN
jgi:hypothetical protein